MATCKINTGNNIYTSPLKEKFGAKHLLVANLVAMYTHICGNVTVAIENVVKHLSIYDGTTLGCPPSDHLDFQWYIVSKYFFWFNHKFFICVTV